MQNSQADNHIEVNAQHNCMQRTSAKLQQLFRQILQVNSKGLQVSASARKAESVSSNKPLVQRGHQQLGSWTNVVEFLLRSPSQDAIDVANSCQKCVRCPSRVRMAHDHLQRPLGRSRKGIAKAKGLLPKLQERHVLVDL